jgi:hypothetical protein
MQPLKDFEFEYHTERGDRFMVDFLNYVNTDYPFFALEDQLIAVMQKRQKTLFRIPATKTVDHREHTFYFRLKAVKENRRILYYEYLGMDLTHQISGSFEDS